MNVNATIIVAAIGVMLLFLIVPKTTPAFSYSTPNTESLTTQNPLLDTINFLRHTSFSSFLPKTEYPHRGTFGASFGVTLGEDCAGGTDTTEGQGPVYDNVASCTDCESIAQCIGSKTGKSDPAYLWDSETKICGVGIEVDDATAASCKTQDKCLGVSKTRFSEVKSDALAVATEGQSFFGNENFAPADLLLAYTYVASKWEEFAGEGVYPDDFCPADKTAFEGPTLCGMAQLQNETPQMDINGDGLPDNRTCLQMPVSKDPDGAAGPECGGRIGLAQALPSLYEQYIFSIVDLANDADPNPWTQYTGFAAAEALIGVSKDNFDAGACVTSCTAKGLSVDVCIAECETKRDECGVLDAYFGAGTCDAPTASQTIFENEVNKYRAVMKSLLDTGICPGEGITSCQDLPDGEVGSIDIARFNQLAPIVTEMVQKVKDLYGYVVRPEYVLSVMLIESGWDPLLNPALRYYYTQSPFTNGIALGQQATFFEICSDPTTASETQAAFGIQCNNMPVSSAGAMGIAQGMPTTWKGVLNQTNNLSSLTGEGYDNPWKDRHAVAFATYFLGQKVFGCGSEETASGAYYSVGCTAPNEHYERVKTVLPTIEALYADACTVPEGDKCPLVMPPFPPVGPTTGCLQLTSDFCPKDAADCACYLNTGGPFTNTTKHRGVDIVGIRSEPIYAVFDAKVIVAEPSCIQGDSSCGLGWGNHIVLQQNGTDFYVLYAHLMDVAVFSGASVSAGAIIGHVDTTGASLGDHLHFESHPSADPRFNRDTVDDPRKYFTCIPDVPTCLDSSKDEFCPIDGTTK